MRHLIYILWVLLLTSCGTTYQLSTLNYDPIYGSDGTEIKIDTIDSEWDLQRKLRKDFRFRWDFATYASSQPYSWYFSNRMFNRYNFYNPYSRFDMYMNSHNFWFDWAFNYPFNNFGYNLFFFFDFYFTWKESE